MASAAATALSQLDGLLAVKEEQRTALSTRLLSTLGRLLSRKSLNTAAQHSVSCSHLLSFLCFVLFF